MFINKRKTLAIIVAALAATQITGCAVLDTVQVEDKETREVAASVVIRPAALHYRRAGVGGIELGYERHVGQGAQFIQRGHFVSFNNQRISGPQTLHNDADIHHGHIAYNQLLDFGKHFELEAALGLAYDQTAVTSRSNTSASQPIALVQRNWGASIGITPRWNFNQYLGCEARLRVGVGFDGTLSQNENLALLLRPTDNVVIAAGYLWYSQEQESPDYNSNVDISFQGPSVALRLIF